MWVAIAVFYPLLFISIYRLHTTVSVSTLPLSSPLLVSGVPPPKVFKEYTTTWLIFVLVTSSSLSLAWSLDTGLLSFSSITGVASPFNSWASLCLQSFSLSWVRSFFRNYDDLVPDVLVLGFGYEKLTATSSAKSAFVFLYCLVNFFFNFGPNSTTFIIPGEVFPTRYRSTAHGISAASGKLGSIISQVGFSKLVNIGGTNAFVKHILELFAFFMLTGIFSTLLLPESNGKTLEELSREDQEGFVKGSATKRRREVIAAWYHIIFFYPFLICCGQHLL